MPELPEVETTRRGIMPHLLERTITCVTVRESRLRWPVPDDLASRIRGRTIASVRRRAKYLLIEVGDATIIVHLGMSGSLRITSDNSPHRLHDHVELRLDSGRALRYHDPRRFGSIHVVDGAPERHPLLAPLGVEPLGGDFDGALLYRFSRARRAPVKSLIMDSRVVVGVGNIYASEALHMAGIHPARPARRIALARYETLAHAVRRVLERSIEQGGTTLRDFVNESGEPGYFAQQLLVYGRAGAPCRTCAMPLRSRTIAQRSTFFCPRCQR